MNVKLAITSHSGSTIFSGIVNFTAVPELGEWLYLGAWPECKNFPEIEENNPHFLVIGKCYQWDKESGSIIPSIDATYAEAGHEDHCFDGIEADSRATLPMVAAKYVCNEVSKMIRRRIGK